MWITFNLYKKICDKDQLLVKEIDNKMEIWNTSVVQYYIDNMTKHFDCLVRKTINNDTRTRTRHGHVN